MSSRGLTLGVFLAIFVFTVVLYFLRPDGSPSGRAGGTAARNEIAGQPAELSGRILSTPEASKKASALVSGRRESGLDVEERPVSLRGIVSDSGGKGVGGARVALLEARAWADGVPSAWSGFDTALEALERLSERSRALAAGAPSTRTADDGGYLFRGLSGGEYRVVVSHSGYLPHRGSWVTISPAEERSGDADGAPVVLDIELLEGHVISGHVVNEHQSPVAGALVSALPSEESRLTGMGRIAKVLHSLSEGGALLSAPEVRTADDGSFRLGSLEPALYDLEARRPPFLPAHLSRVPPGGQEILLVLAAGAAVTGRVVDSRGEAIVGAEVIVARPGKASARFQAAPPTVAAADPPREEARLVVTRDGGRFRVGGLGRGTYALIARAEGFPVYSEKLEMVDDRPLDLGEIALADPLSISGVLVGPDGFPVAGARVWASVVGGGDEDPAISETESDSAGLFELRGLMAGQYTIRALAPEMGEASAETVEAGAVDVTLTLERGMVIEGVVLDAGDRSPIPGVRVRLGRSRSAETALDGRFEIRGIPTKVVEETGAGAFLEFQHVDYERGFQQVVAGEGDFNEVLLTPGRGVSGVVRDAKGNPVSRARVAVEVPGFPTVFVGVQAGGNESFTSEDGRFFLKVPRLALTRTFDVTASHPRLGKGRLESLELSPDGGRFAEIALTLKPTFALEGRVTGPSGAAIRGARVRAIRRVRESVEAMMVAALMPSVDGVAGYSRRDGSFRIPNLEPGDYRLEVVALGYATKTIPAVEVGPFTQVEEITLDAGAPLSGRVVDSRGDPVAGAEVVALIEPEDNPEDAPRFAAGVVIQGQKALGMGHASTRSDEDGRYELDRLPEREFRVVARKGGFVPAEFANVTPPSSLPDLVLTPHASLSGWIVDGDTGSPVVSFLVSLRRETAPPGAVSRVTSGCAGCGDITDRPFDSPEGRFFLPGLPPGTYVLTVGGEGYVPRSQELSLGGGEDIEIETVLSPGASVEGAVKSAVTEEPVSGATVSLIRMPEADRASRRRSEARSAATDQDGRYRVRGLSKGWYRVSVQHAGYYRDGGPEGLEIAGRGIVTLNVEMVPAGRLQGRVKNANVTEARLGTRRYTLLLVPVREKTLDDVPEAKEMQEHPLHSRTVWVNVDGTYHAESIPPGTYRVELETRTYARTEERTLEERSWSATDVGSVEILAGRAQVLDVDAP